MKYALCKSAGLPCAVTPVLGSLGIMVDRVIMMMMMITEGDFLPLPDPFPHPKYLALKFKLITALVVPLLTVTLPWKQSAW